MEKYRAKMEQILDYMEHNAEAGFKEWKGNALMLEAYRELGFKPVEAGNIPGFYADLDTGRPGPKILVFSELDGLPVPCHPNADPETKEAHACGHNARCAALYGCAAAQALILYRLLEDDAAKAKDVLENAKPNFASYKEYMDYLDSMFIKKQAVEYLENGETLLK